MPIEILKYGMGKHTRYNRKPVIKYRKGLHPKIEILKRKDRIKPIWQDRIDKLNQEDLEYEGTGSLNRGQLRQPTLIKEREIAKENLQRHLYETANDRSKLQKYLDWKIHGIGTAYSKEAARLQKEQIKEDKTPRPTIIRKTIGKAKNIIKKARQNERESIAEERERVIEALPTNERIKNLFLQSGEPIYERTGCGI